MRRTEHMHNTTAQIAGYLDEAYRIVLDAGIPFELQVAALPEVIKLVAGKQIVFEQVSPLGIVAPGLGQG